MRVTKTDSRQLQFVQLLTVISPAPERKRAARKVSRETATGEAPLLSVPSPKIVESRKRDEPPRTGSQVDVAGLGDLRREVDSISDGKGSFRDAGQPRDFRAFTPAPPDARLRDERLVRSPAQRGPFGRWLLRQAERDDLIGMLAKGALVDQRFPASGTPEAVRKHLRRAMADGEVAAALDEAEIEWSYR